MLGRKKNKNVNVRQALNQSGGSLIYRKADEGLYFCGPSSVEICSLLQKVFLSMKISRPFEYARFDDYGAVFVGIKVEVRSDEYPAIASALRLSGLEIDSI